MRQGRNGRRRARHCSRRHRRSGQNAPIDIHVPQMVPVANGQLLGSGCACREAQQWEGTHQTERNRTDGERRFLRTGQGHGDVSLCRSEENTSELPSLMRLSYAVFCLKKKTNTNKNTTLYILIKSSQASYLPY